jgi:hypothetical protein
MPFVYNIPDSAYVDGKGSYDVSRLLVSALQQETDDVKQITVQLTSGLSYVILMGDAMGISSGGSSGVRLDLHSFKVNADNISVAQRITVQGYAESACLGTAGTNQTTLDLSFEVFATNIQQCETSFNMSWDLTPAARPA